jgi:hypothetical protein
MTGIKFSPVVSVLFALGLFWLAWTFAALGIDLRGESKRMVMWPSTEGVIVKAEMKSERVRRLNPLAPRRGRRSIYVHSTTIAYEYSVDGQPYVSTSISRAKGFDALIESRGQMGGAYQGTWLAKYPEGKRVIVYYDPEDPATAVVERDEPWITYLIFAAAVATALVGLAFLSSAREQWKESRA